MHAIYPPRPEGKIPPTQLDRLESRGKHIVQRKFRGSRNLIHRLPDGEIELFSRYGRRHLKYDIPTYLRAEIESLAFEDGKEYWLDSELMHPHIDHTIILFDVLQEGKYLYGVDQMSRLEILSRICRNPIEYAEPAIAMKATENVWLAEWWDSDFEEHFEEFLELDHIEGLVLREKKSSLDNFGAKQYDVDWQIRCRKPGPTYEL